MCLSEDPNDEARVMVLHDNFMENDNETEMMNSLMNINGTDVSELGLMDDMELVPEKVVDDAKTGEELPLEEMRKGRMLELNRMAEFQVYEDVDEQQAWGKETVGSKWLDEWKLLEDGTWAVRSRLVATQVAYEKRDDAFAATPPLKGTRILLSLAASKEPKGMRRLGRWDCSVAFFHAQILEELYAAGSFGSF